MRNNENVQILKDNVKEHILNDNKPKCVRKRNAKFIHITNKITRKE